MARSSSAFPSLGLSRGAVAALGALAALAMLGYALSSGQGGFPLDDAWIHLTYARNLALHGEWAFIPGQPSSAATSLLWVLLLAPGAWLGLAPQVWPWLLGWLSLWGLGVFVAASFARLVAPQWAGWAVIVAGLVMLEYHLVWAALSGMETVLFAALCIAGFYFSLGRHPQPLLAGALAGLAMLVRPEGLTLLAPLGLTAWLGHTPSRWRAVMQMLVGFALFLVPYCLFNYSLSGNWWPNTLYAKQAEYAELLAQPLLARWAAQAAAPLTGLGVVALPGFLMFLLAALKSRHFVHLGWAVWLLGFLLLFALRLPVTYQYGRYAMPVIAVYLALSAAGAAGALAALSAAWRRKGAAAWLATAALIAIAFYLLGARAYQRDVSFIETQMVATAHWVADNTPSDARLAAHDIGALGYFAPRPLVDLAGLTSPELVTFLQNQAQLTAYLNEIGVDYLVAFPGWHSDLAEQGQLVYQSPAPDEEFDLGPLSVYRWVGGTP